jgi:mono/diheme cytochrome c family protein
VTSVRAAAGLLAVVVGWLAIRALLAAPVREELPSEYAGLVNPRAADPQAVAMGAQLFRENCASCHGEDADGHGPAARGLTPPPANFRSGEVQALHSDAYLYYRITMGKPGTAMPSFNGAFDPSARWALVAFLRALDQRR